MRLVIPLAVVLIACSVAPVKTPPPPRQVEVMALRPTVVRDTNEYLGTLTSRQNVDVLPQVGGYVRKIAVRPGQRVQAGATLLEIDARQEASALESARAQQAAAVANLELARQTLARTRELSRDGLVSAQELERAAAATQAAEAAYTAATAAVSQRQVQLQYYAVRAPFAGVVGDVVVKIGDFVTPTTPVTSVAEGDVLEVSVAVPAARARQVSPKTPIELLDAQGAVTLSTAVYFVAPEASPRTQLVELKAAFNNTAGLLPNEVVRARVVYGERQALQVPAMAVVRQSGQAFAYVVRQQDGATLVRLEPVTLGPLGEQAYVVESGLREGEQVAVSSVQALRDGSPVTVKSVTAAVEP